MGRANAPITNVADRDGLRVELLELGPDSMARKATNAWK
jgi:hypothetical protein